MPASWFFPKIGPWRVQGRGLAEDNFAQEARTSLEILVREALQNPLDARAKTNTGPIRVVIKRLLPGQFDRAYLQSLITEDYADRMGAAIGNGAGLDFETASVLVIEDFGTTGLLGTHVDSTVDGSGENWNAFWFREGEGSKSALGSNGRAGQGKVTYYRIGAARAVFGLTVRESDGNNLLMGRSSFLHTYFHRGVKYERDAFWCFQKEGQIFPTDDPGDIDVFRRAFVLQRDGDTGLSLVVPFTEEFDETEVVRTVISEFYFPILRGRLDVKIGDMEITGENIDAVAEHVFTDEIARQKGSSFTKGFRTFVRGVVEDETTGKMPVDLKSGWEKNASLKEDVFPDGVLDDLRSALVTGGRISVRFPLTVRPKKSTPVSTWFDVHLQIPDDLDRAEEAYIRRDLLIGSELHLAGSTYLQKARGLTLIEDDSLSAFLADAEEPTHLKWNGSRPRLAEEYQSPKEVVRSVRQALPRLLTLLSGGIMTRDVKALARYFTKPAEQGTRHTPGGKDTKGKDTKPIVDPPEPKRKPFRLDTGVDWVSVCPNGSVKPVKENLPISCVLEVAYEGLDQDPFSSYDPFDFDLADNKANEAECKGVSITERKGNRIEFEVMDPDFILKIGGFESNIRMRARLTYKEKEDGATIGAEQSH